MMKPEISIIIPAYCAENTINKAIDSVWGKCRHSIEIIVVENGNNEEAISALESAISKYNDTVKLLHSESGVSNARNVGVEAANGEWITFLDADDWLSSDSLDTMVDYAEESDSDIVMGEMLREYEKKSIPLTCYANEPRVFCESKICEFEQDVLKIQTGACFTCGKIFNREFFLRNKLLFKGKLAAAEDIEVMVRAAHCASRITCLPVYVYHYWYNPASAVRKFREDYAQRYLLAIAEIRGELGNRTDADIYMGSYYSFVLYHLLMISVNYSFHAKHTKGAISQIREYRKLLENPYFEEALNHIHYKDFSLTRKIPLFCTKHRLLWGVWLVAKVRQMQFKAMS